MRRLISSALLTAGAVSALVVWAPAGSATLGVPQLSNSAPLRYGGATSLSVIGLQPLSNYTVSSTDGAFDFSWSQHSLDFTSSQTGTETATVQMPSNDPVDQITLNLTETGQSTVLATLVIPIAPPTLSTFQSPCPGSSMVVTGTGFADGSYQLHTTAGTLDPTPANLYRGALTSKTLSLPKAVAPFTVTVTKDGDSSPIASKQFSYRNGSLSLVSQSAWQGTLDGNCYAPGERISFTAPADLQLPDDITADNTGSFSVTATYRPDLQTTPDATVSATGQTSGQTATSNTVQIYSNTLRSGQVLSGSNAQLLASANPGYIFFAYLCDAPIKQTFPAGLPPIWSARVNDASTGSGCFGYLRPDGNFILYSAANKILWATNTSGDGNRLVLQNTGVLQVLSADNKVLWSSAIVPSYAYLTGSRSGSAVYVNALIKQRGPTAQLVRSPNRTVYLQRYLNGSWQNVLSRIADSAGQFTVGFVQAKVYSYRLLVLPATNMPVALSNTVQK